jgi:hypothetical protein
MQIIAGSTPQDIYTVLSITAETMIDVQNKTSRPLMIYAGAAAPATLDDYFILDAYEIARYQGTVCMIWSDTDVRVMVQEIV